MLISADARDDKEIYILCIAPKFWILNQQTESHANILCQIYVNHK